jgi:hypothetical protein
VTKSFDVGQLLCALPFRPLSAEENLLDGYDPPVWRYPMLGHYNGFTGEQRIGTWQLETWLVDRRGKGTPLAG